MARKKQQGSRRANGGGELLSTANFPSRLRSFRESKGLSQGALAELVGIHQVNISNYERGFSLPQLDTAVRLARALGVELAELLENAPTPA